MSFDDSDYSNDEHGSVNQWSVLLNYDSEEKTQPSRKQEHPGRKQNNSKNSNRKKQSNKLPIHKMESGKSIKNVLQTLPIELIYQLFNYLTVRECCLKIKPLSRWFHSIFGIYLQSGQVRELNICKEVYYSAFLKEKEGLLESNELFNFYFRSKEEIERMKYFRSVFMGNFVNGVQRIVFEKVKDFPLGLLVKCDDSNQVGGKLGIRGGKSRGKNSTMKAKSSSCLFSNFEMFWNGVKSLEINSSTFCNHAMSSALDFDSMDEEKSGLELLSGIVSNHLLNLESLSLKNIKYSAEETKDCELYKKFVAKVLKSSSKLKSLCFEYSSGVLCEETFQSNYPNISYLRIIDDESKCINLKQFPNLTKLELNYYEGSIQDVLTTFPHLEILVLNYCILRDLETIVNFPPNLKQFDISFCKFYSDSPDSRHLVLEKLCECSHLQSLSIVKVEYIDNYCDFRNSQSDFDNFMERLPTNLKLLRLDNLQKVQTLKSLRKFTKIETLHCFGSYCRGADNIKLLEYFHQIRDISLDCIQALGRDLSVALQALSKCECKSTLETIHIERWSTYDINLESKMQYIQLDRLPSLPNLMALRIIGYYFENEEKVFRSKDPDLKSIVSTHLPKLQTLVISSMVSSLSGIKYLKQQPNHSSTIDNSSSEDSSLLHFDFWTRENKQVQKQQLLVSKKFKKKNR